MSRRQRIFLVDDDPLNLKIMEEILGTHYELAVAKSGEECLELARVVPPSLILLDIMLPGIDGYETCRRLREDPQLRYVKVILVSAKVHLEDRLKGYESEADDYITKPFDADELLAKIRVSLRLRYAEEMEEFKGQFLNLLAHETRTPLTGILSPARLLRDSKEIPEELSEEMTELIIQNAESLQRLVQRAADLCSFKAGRAVLAETPVDLVALAENLARDLQPAATEKSILFEIHAADAPTVMGDAEKLMIALRTVMDNAIVHGYPGSSVEVRISEGKYGAEIQVENHGEVVDEERMPYVFDAFRVHDVDHYGKGVGVDLALAREIARAHGGELDCRFGTGETMVFRLWLPQERESPSTSTASTRPIEKLAR